MAKKDDNKPYQGRGSKGYSRKIHFKLSKKIYADFKKKGLDYTWNDAQKFTSLYLFEDYKDDFVSKIDLNEVEGAAGRVKKSEFDNALKIPKIASTLSAPTTPSHFSPNSMRTMSDANKKSNMPNGMTTNAMTTVTLRNALFNLFNLSFVF